MWKAIEAFWLLLAPSALDLRLNRVQNVGEIGLYDIGLQFVDASDFPGSAIEFDAVMASCIMIATIMTNRS